MRKSHLVSLHGSDRVTDRVAERLSDKPAARRPIVATRRTVAHPSKPAVAAAVGGEIRTMAYQMGFTSGPSN